MTVRESKNVIAIIPARGGSKGIPGKNLIDFCGKPLLSWSILQAQEAITVNQVYVSSNDNQILSIASQFGAIPIKRPQDLATDTASSEGALRHVLTEIEKSNDNDPDLIVFLQATSPLREPEDIDGAVRKLKETGADSLFSMSVLEDFCIWTEDDSGLKGLSFDPFNRGRRQERKPLYLENGSIYVFSPEILRKNNNRLGGQITMFEMPYWKSYEIDTIKDIEVCKYYFENKLLSRWEKQSQGIPIGNIDLVVYDFDGVMTDNRVIVSQNGMEAIVANRADGLGVNRINELGIPQLILSTEMNPVVQARGAKLGLEVITGCEDKKITLQIYCRQHGYDLGKVVFVGNDVNDLEAMKLVGYSVAPRDAHAHVRALARILTRAGGGEGVIKELSELFFP